MGLEVATYIADLVSTNPVVGDQVSTADDHLRLIKAVLQATLPGASASLRQNFVHVLSSVSGTNTITATSLPAIAAYTSPTIVVMTPANTNTGATTLNVDSRGALDVFNIDGTACVGGELVAGIPAVLVLDSGADDFVIANPSNAFDIRVNIQNNNYSFQLSDRGKLVLANSAGPYTFTIPANASVAFPVGSSIQVMNFAASGMTIPITSDTLAWGSGSGSISTGTRTIASAGVAHLLKVTSTTWVISGWGIT